MMSSNLKRLGCGMKIAGSAFLIALFLFADSPTLRTGDIAGSILREVEVAFRDVGTQWMVVLCLAIYLAGFLWLQMRQGTSLFWRRTNSRPWLIGAFVAAVLGYAFNYSAASKSTAALVFFAGAVLGQGAVARGARRESRDSELFWPLIIFVALLSAAAVWKTDTRTFSYQDHTRWFGPWDNPNIFGSLMGTGIALALGLGVSEWKTGDVKPERANRSWRSGAGKYAVMVLCLIAAVFMGRGLLHSYSRGAWFATLCGLVCLVWHIGQRPKLTVQSISWFNKNWLTFSVVILSVLFLSFWQFRQTKWHPVRRAFSAVNTVDFSWRNRVIAWEGALQIMAEHPWIGVGWNQPELLYEHYYLPSKLTESAAIEMNDYLMLGATLGTPALVCFGVYIWLSLRGVSGVRRQVSGKTSSEQLGTSEMDWLQTTCRAGAIVLLVGFWFDGGLFKLPTASVFWILLELGRRDLVQPERTEGMEMQQKL